MPYQNERANPYGYSDLIKEQFILDRLKHYKHFNIMTNFNPLDYIELHHNSMDNIALPKYNLAIDGSMSSINIDKPNFEVGFIKIGIVFENLKKIKILAKQKYVSQEDYNSCYKTYTLNGMLPGKGIITEGLKNSHDSFRQEIYENMLNMKINPLGLITSNNNPNLLNILKFMTPTGRLKIQCRKCYWNDFIEDVIITCPQCKKSTLYFSDFLDLDTRFNAHGTNASNYSEVMSTFERIAMTGLISEISSEKNNLNISSFSFITDGPLALFRSNKLAPLILEYMQSLPVFPLLLGLEKTGQFVDFAQSSLIQNFMNPGDYFMITDEIAQIVSGRNDLSYNGESFYGRRFVYKTLKGNKTFVFSLPPAVGQAYGEDDVAVNINNYPTLERAIQVIEASQTNMYGLNTPAISTIAKANDTASIPQNFGNNLLEKYINDNINI